MPTISALCHGRNFAPRLHPGDDVIYMTKKERFADHSQPHRRLVAVLKVLHRFETHRQAANWFQSGGLALPNNCMVPDNPCVPLDRTDLHEPSLREWDIGYLARSRKCGVFLVCDPVALDLYTPPIITDGDLVRVFGRIPGTRNPPSISEAQFDQLSEILHSHIAASNRSAS